MLFSLHTALSLSALLFTTTTSAAPTRTHCRCTIVPNAVPPPPIYSPSVAHWTPTDPSPSPAAQDFCANLGPELENFPHAARAFIDAHSSADDEQQTSSTSTSSNIYVNFASSRNRDASNEPRPTERPHQRIVCREEPEPFTAYQDSCATLWTLHIIVAVAILACLAEGVQLGIQRYQASLAEQPDDKQDGYFRLPGSEKLLLAIPATQVEESMFSPGVEKKLCAGAMSAVHAHCGKREFVAYEDEDDDEANRPVM